MDHYRRGAEKGDPWAQYELATAYLHGLYGLPEDPAEAFRLYSLSAEAGITDSCSRLANCYALGEGTSQDYEAAIHWYYRAYENGENSSMPAFGDFSGLAQEILSKYLEEKNRDLRLRYFRLAREAVEKRIEVQKALMDEPARDFLRFRHAPELRSASNTFWLKTVEDMLVLLEVQAALDGYKW